MKRAIVFLLVTVLWACATDSPEKKRFLASMDKWVGHSADELVGAKGAPANVFLLDSGGREFEYSVHITLTEVEEEALGTHTRRHTGGSITARPDTRPPSRVRRGGLRENVLGAGRTCMVSFDVNADNIITSWDIEDGSCY